MVLGQQDILLPQMTDLSCLQNGSAKSSRKFNYKKDRLRPGKMLLLVDLERKDCSR